MKAPYLRYAELRDAAGLKDADVAKAAEIGQSTFSDWKSGRSQPKTDKLLRIAAVLNTTVEELFIKIA